LLLLKSKAFDVFTNRKTVDIKLDSKLDAEAAKVLRMNGGSDPLELVKVQDLVNKYFKKADDVTNAQLFIKLKN
jgi:hypothetical protein